MGQYEKLRAYRAPHEITGVLKLFARELKQPIIPLKLFKNYIPTDLDFQSLSDKQKHEKISGMLGELANEKIKRNYETLKYLIKHFKK